MTLMTFFYEFGEAMRMILLCTDSQWCSLINKKKSKLNGLK